MAGLEALSPVGIDFADKAVHVVHLVVYIAFVSVLYLYLGSAFCHHH